jgi:hypothetical protein
LLAAAAAAAGGGVVATCFLCDFLASLLSAGGEAPAPTLRDAPTPLLSPLLSPPWLPLSPLLEAAACGAGDALVGCQPKGGGLSRTFARKTNKQTNKTRSQKRTKHAPSL